MCDRETLLGRVYFNLKPIEVWVAIWLLLVASVIVKTFNCIYFLVSNDNYSFTFTQYTA